VFPGYLGEGSSAERLALAAGCHENQRPKRGKLNEQKKASKRNVAKRPLQALFGAIFAE
jgi:hypothetical protein